MKTPSNAGIYNTQCNGEICERGFTLIPPTKKVNNRFNVRLAVIGRSKSGDTLTCDNIEILDPFLEVSPYDYVVGEMLRVMKLRRGINSLGIDVKSIRIPSFCELANTTREALKKLAMNARQRLNNYDGRVKACIGALNNPVIVVMWIQFIRGSPNSAFSRRETYGIAFPVASLTNPSNYPEVCSSQQCRYTSLPVMWCSKANLLFIGYPICELNNTREPSCNTTLVCPLAYLFAGFSGKVRNRDAVISRFCGNVVPSRTINTEINNSGQAVDADCSDVYEYIVRSRWVQKFTPPHVKSVRWSLDCGRNVQADLVTGSITVGFDRAKILIGKGRWASDAYDYYPAVRLRARISDTYILRICISGDIVDKAVDVITSAPPTSIHLATLAAKAVLFVGAALQPKALPKPQTVANHANNKARLSLRAPYLLDLSISGLRYMAEHMRDNTKDFVKLIRNVALLISNKQLNDYLKALVVHSLVNVVAAGILDALDLDEDSVGTLVFTAKARNTGASNQNYLIVIYENIDGGIAALETLDINQLAKSINNIVSIWSSVYNKYAPQPSQARQLQSNPKYSGIISELHRIHNELKQLGQSFTLVPSWVARLAFTGSWAQKVSKGAVAPREWSQLVAEIVPSYFDLDMHDADSSTLILERARKDLDEMSQRFFVSGYALQAVLPILQPHLKVCGSAQGNTPC